MNIFQKTLQFISLSHLSSLLKTLSVNDELSRHENLWTWILRWVPRSFATHASFSNTLPSNKLYPKTVKILALKGLKKDDISRLMKDDDTTNTLTN